MWKSVSQSLKSREWFKQAIPWMQYCLFILPRQRETTSGVGQPLMSMRNLLWNDLLKTSWHCIISVNRKKNSEIIFPFFLLPAILIFLLQKKKKKFRALEFGFNVCNIILLLIKLTIFRNSSKKDKFYWEKANIVGNIYFQ